MRKVTGLSPVSRTTAPRRLDTAFFRRAQVHVNRLEHRLAQGRRQFLNPLQPLQHAETGLDGLRLCRLEAEDFIGADAQSQGKPRQTIPDGLSAVMQRG